MIVGRALALVDKVAEDFAELESGILAEQPVVVDFELEFQMKSLN